MSSFKKKKKKEKVWHSGAPLNPVLGQRQAHLYEWWPVWHRVKSLSQKFIEFLVNWIIWGYKYAARQYSKRHLFHYCDPKILYIIDTWCNLACNFVIRVQHSLLLDYAFLFSHGNYRSVFLYSLPSKKKKKIGHHYGCHH